MHISVYEAKCATTHSHISVYGRHAVRSRDIGARISNWIIYYLLTQYIFLHFLQPRVMLDCELAPRQIRLAALLNCPHTINSLVFFRIRQLISSIFSMYVPRPLYIVALFYEKRTRHFLLPIVHYDFLRVTSPFNRSTFLSQVRTNGSATNHSRFSTRKRSFRRKPINPIGRISEALCAHHGKPWHAHTYERWNSFEIPLGIVEKKTRIPGE